MSRMIRKSMDEVRRTPVDKKRLAEIAALPDSEIDYSDIPPLTEKFWKNAVRNPWYRPVKKQVTLRIDADVLAWLKRKNETGYQTRLNAVLRKAMLSDLRKERKTA